MRLVVLTAPAIVLAPTVSLATDNAVWPDTFLIWLFIAYAAGTCTGFAMYRRSLLGRIYIAFDKVLSGKEK